MQIKFKYCLVNLECGWVRWWKYRHGRKTVYCRRPSGTPVPSSCPRNPTSPGFASVSESQSKEKAHCLGNCSVSVCILTCPFIESFDGSLREHVGN